ncbi:DNA polymerase ligase N-terminal domain-containing protein [Saccharomonospora xinjiangensis]|nr:ATP-dependent DNA ligase [Saccharomonospora xinjiangensis]
MADRDARGDMPATPSPRQSAETRGLTDSRPRQSLYVVERQAGGPHYELRLRLGDVTSCWVIPEPPSPAPGGKLLAIRIPDSKARRGEKSEVWDTGTVGNLGDRPWEPALAEGRLSLHLHGGRLNGVFVLVRAHRSPDHEQWLLVTKATGGDRVPGPRSAATVADEPWQAAVDRGLR